MSCLEYRPCTRRPQVICCSGWINLSRVLAGSGLFGTIDDGDHLSAPCPISRQPPPNFFVGIVQALRPFLLLSGPRTFM